MLLLLVVVCWLSLVSVASAAPTFNYYNRTVDPNCTTPGTGPVAQVLDLVLQYPPYDGYCRQCVGPQCAGAPASWLLKLDNSSRSTSVFLRVFESSTTCNDTNAWDISATTSSGPDIACTFGVVTNPPVNGRSSTYFASFTIDFTGAVIPIVPSSSGGGGSGGGGNSGTGSSTGPDTHDETERSHTAIYVIVGVAAAVGVLAVVGALYWWYNKRLQASRNAEDGGASGRYNSME